MTCGYVSRAAGVFVNSHAQTIITSIKAQTFAGMHFLFSSVIPLDVKPEESVAFYENIVL